MSLHQFLDTEMDPFELLKFLRNLVGKNQAEAASYFGLTAPSSHQTYSKWERGIVFPGKIHREKWITFLWYFLKCRDTPELLKLIWDKIAIEEWGYEHLKEDDLPPDYPQRLLKDTNRAIPFQTPVRPKHFVGRTTIFDAVKDYLADVSSSPLIVITGMPGVGKTLLASKLAHELQPDFSDGVLWTDLGLSSVKSALRNFISSYDPWFIQNTASLKLKDHEYVRYLSTHFKRLMINRQVLIILDEVKSKSDFELFLPSVSSSTIIAITQSRYLLTKYHALSIDLPKFDPTKSEAVNLMMQVIDQARRERITNGMLVVGEVHGDFDPEVYEKIVSLLDHHPHGVNLAASQIAYQPGWTAEIYLDRLTDENKRKNLLGLESEDTWISLQLTYEGLPQAIKSFFAILGIFDGNPFSIQAAEDVSQTESDLTHDYLIQLYGLSLTDEVRINSYPETRYQLHRVISDYALSKISDLPKVEKRLAIYYSDYFRKNSKNFEVVTREEQIIDRIWHLLEIHSLNTEFIELTIALFPFLESRGEFQKSKKLLERSLVSARETDNERQICALQRALGSVLIRLGDYTGASENLEQAYTLAQQLEDNELKMDCLQSLGLVKYHLAEFKDAKRFYLKGQQVAQDSDNLRRMVSFKVNLSTLYGLQGQLSGAIDELEAALPVARKINAKEPIVVILHNLSGMNIHQGDLINGSKQIAEAIKLAEAEHFWGRLPDLLITAGELAKRKGDFSKAKEETTEALNQSRAREHAKSLMFALENLGDLELLNGNLVEAERYIQQGLSMASNFGNLERIVGLQALKGALLCEGGEYSDAKKLLAETLTLAQTHSLKIHESKIFNYLGEVAIRVNDIASAHAHYSKSKEFAETDEFSSKVDLAEALFGLAKIEKAKGNQKAANDWGKQSQTVFKKMGHYKAAEVENWRLKLDIPAD